MLADTLQADLFTVFLVFLRVGSALMLLPGFSEAYVTPRVRLVFALVIAAVAAPPLAPRLPELPSAPLALFILVAGEIGVGLFLGVVIRLLLTGLQVAGMVIAYHSSLANALVFDPSAAQQGVLAGNFLTAVGLLLVFVTNLHHVMLEAVVDSYALFVPGQVPPLGDVADTVARTVSQSFLLGVQIGAPFVVVGLALSLGVGLLARLMPQVQIYFVVMPVQIMVGFLVLLLTLSAGMMWFLTAFEGNLGTILADI